MADPALRLQDIDIPADNVIDCFAEKSDSTDLTFNTRFLYLGTAGAIKVDTVGGQTITIASIVAGTVLRLRIKRLWSTGTTVTTCVGFY